MTRIMVVDDEKDSQWVFELTLEDQGYLVDSFNDPTRALTAFKPEYYDLIILDYRMAGLNGLALIQKIKALDKSAKAILLTAWETRSISDETKKWFTKVLSKPIAGENLIAEIRLALG